jgi:hypothetical protein
MKVEFFEPPMCCSSGICGPSVDETLVQLNEDIAKLKQEFPGITVERYMISQQPLKFKGNVAVFRLIKENGKEVLPITIVNGRVAKTGKYPSYDEIVSEIEGDK